MKDIQSELATWGSAQILAMEKAKTANVCGVVLGLEDIQIVRKAKVGKLASANYGLVAELDIQMSPELEAEGLARDVVHSIQQGRKEAKFHLADRIHVQWAAPAGSKLSLLLKEESKIAGLISQETLSVSWKEEATIDGLAEDFGAAGTLQFKLTKV